MSYSIVKSVIINILYIHISRSLKQKCLYNYAALRMRNAAHSTALVFKISSKFQIYSVIPGYEIAVYETV